MLERQSPVDEDRARSGVDEPAPLRRRSEDAVMTGVTGEVLDEGVEPLLLEPGERLVSEVAEVEAGVHHPPQRVVGDPVHVSVVRSPERDEPIGDDAAVAHREGVREGAERLIPRPRHAVALDPVDHQALHAEPEGVLRGRPDAGEPVVGARERAGSVDRGNGCLHRDFVGCDIRSHGQVAESQSVPRRPTAARQLDEIVTRLVRGPVGKRLLRALAARDDRPRAGREDGPSEHGRADIEHRAVITAGDDVDRPDRIEVRRPVAADSGPDRLPRAALDARDPRVERGVGRDGDRRHLAVAADDLEPDLRSRGRQLQDQVLVVGGRLERRSRRP